MPLNSANGITHSAPAVAVRAVTPHDTNELSQSDSGEFPRGLYVGTTGNIALVAMNDSASVTLTAVPVGFVPIRCRKVLSTGTTASNIVALY